MRDRWCWIDGCIVLVLVAAALLGGWGARGWVEGYKAWLDTPIVTIEQEGPKDVSVCVSRELPTLWHIAREYYPEKHTGMMVEEIRKANPGLDPGRLQIGQVVVLP
jgi:hypothetical protein